MHPLARRHFEKVLSNRKLVKANRNCKYYPCHSNLEDCTWCYCPFYPCGDQTLGGKWLKSGTWSCQDCTWIHRREVAKEVLNKLKTLAIQKPEDLEKKRKELLKIREEIKAKFPET